VAICTGSGLTFSVLRDKLGIAAWDYLDSRLKVAGAAISEQLDHYIKARRRPA